MNMPPLLSMWALREKNKIKPNFDTVFLIQKNAYFDQSTPHISSEYFTNDILASDNFTKRQFYKTAFLQMIFCQ